METKFDKVLESGRRVVVYVKRKQPAQFTISPTSAKDALPHTSCNKRGKLESSSAFASGKRLLRYYTHYKKTGMLKRLMSYNNNEWTDFSTDVVALVNKDLSKNAAMEVDISGKKHLLDFLHMVQLDMETGLCNPIAWIDVSENCFFPEVVSDYDASLLKTNDINLNLEVEIDELDDIAESSGESDNMAVKEINESCPKAPTAEAQQQNGNLNVAAIPRPGFVAPDVLNNIFREATGPSAVIVDVRQCSSFSLEARWELFCKQVEITKRQRGVPNVRYAWLPCSGKTASAVGKFGVGYCGPTRILPKHGDGVHLVPIHRTRVSINYFDVDENNTLHMVLCRVIMGNMEFVRSGSNQFHPSSEHYDSGVDNLMSPSRYVVWNMNASSHIYPVCVVSFKMNPGMEEPVVGNSPVNELSGTTTCDEGHQGPKTPTSPWISFSGLLSFISRRISSENFGIVKRFHEMYQNKQISRETFMRMLRVVVGDALLKVAIIAVRAKASEGEDTASSARK